MATPKQTRGVTMLTIKKALIALPLALSLVTSANAYTKQDLIEICKRHTRENISMIEEIYRVKLITGVTYEKLITMVVQDMAPQCYTDPIKGIETGNYILEIIGALIED